MEQNNARIQHADLLGRKLVVSQKGNGKRMSHATLIYPCVLDLSVS